MSNNNNGGGSGLIVVIILLILLAALYQCVGVPQYHLPSILGGGTAGSSSSASDSAASGATSADVIIPSSLQASAISDSASASGSSAASSSSSSATSAATSSAPPSGGFTYLPATDLKPGSWTGPQSSPPYTNTANWSPAMCFPLAEAGYANSQVYNDGGQHGAGPDQCVTANYSYPWRDIFCETRSGTNPLCPTGHGHQGQDIRPATCKPDASHDAIAAEAGTIIEIKNYWVTMRASASPFRRYSYLHMKPSTIAVHVGQTVVAGQFLGRVSTYFGTTPTTRHLHFEILISASDGTVPASTVFVPPYVAMVAAYQRKLAGHGCAEVQ